MIFRFNMAESSGNKRSNRNRGPMSEEKYHLLCEVAKGNPNKDPTVDEFEKNNLSFIYQSSCKDKPKYAFHENNLVRIDGQATKIVVHEKQAEEIVRRLHKPEGRACRAGGVRKVFEEFQSRYFLKGCDKLVRKVLRECTGTCQRLKQLKTRQPPPKLIRTFGLMERVEIDLIEMYSSSSEFVTVADHTFRYILSAIDTFSKYCWLVPLSSKSAENVARSLQHIFQEYGCPETLHSDNGGEFTGQVVKSLCQKMNIKQIHGAPYHPQSQGQVESLNKRVKTVLNHRLLDFSPDEQCKSWPFLLPEVNHILNNTWNGVLKCTPFQVFFGRDSRLFQNDDSASPINIVPTDSYLRLLTSNGENVDKYDDSVALYELKKSRHDQLMLVRENCERKYYENYRAYIKKCPPRHFTIGQMVTFVNPEQYGLVQLPNCTGVIKAELPCNYYKVEYVDGNGDVKMCILYSTMLVGSVTSDSSCTLEPSSTLNEEMKLKKITVNEFALTLREEFFNNAREKSGPVCEDQSTFHKLMSDIGVSVTSLEQSTVLMDLFCYSCDLRYIVVNTADTSFAQLCVQNAQSILRYLKKIAFEYYLSAIQAWEQSRTYNEVNLMQAISNSELPPMTGASHYCIECIASMVPCKHLCCQEYFIRVGRKCKFLENNTLTPVPSISSSIQSETASVNPITMISSKKAYSRKRFISKRRKGPKTKKCKVSRPSAPQTKGLVLNKSDGEVVPSTSENVSVDAPTTVTAVLLSQSQEHVEKCNDDYSTSKCDSELSIDAPPVTVLSTKTQLLQQIDSGKSITHSTSETVMSLRGTTTFNSCNLYKRTSLSSLPMKLSVRRLDSIQQQLQESTDARMKTFASKTLRCISDWDFFTDAEQNTLSVNMRYASGVMCTSTSSFNALNSKQTKSGYFIQQQGKTNLCGLCCLNNMYQGHTLQFAQSDIDSIADDLWFKHWLTLDMEPTEPVQAMRSQFGDYSIDVLLAAISLKGDTLTCLNVSVRSFIHQNFKGDYLVNRDSESTKNSLVELLSGDKKMMPAIVLLKHRNYHYTCFRIESGPSILWFDSKKRDVRCLSLFELHAIFKKEFKVQAHDEVSTAAVFLLERHTPTREADLEQITSGQTSRVAEQDMFSQSGALDLPMCTSSEVECQQRYVSCSQECESVQDAMMTSQSQSHVDVTSNRYDKDINGMNTVSCDGFGDDEGIIII